MSTVGKKCHKLLIKLLIEARKEKGITQTTLAKRLKKHNQNWVARLESGERRVDVCELILLGKAIGFDPVAVMRQVCKVVKV